MTTICTFQFTLKLTTATIKIRNQHSIIESFPSCQIQSGIFKKRERERKREREF